MKTLTGNDLALATFACGLAISWWKDQKRSTFKTKQIAKYKALIRKIDGITDHAHPLTINIEGTVLEFGDEPIMRTDEKVIRKLQARLKREGAIR